MDICADKQTVLIGNMKDYSEQ